LCAIDVIVAISIDVWLFLVSGKIRIEKKKFLTLPNSWMAHSIRPVRYRTKRMNAPSMTIPGKSLFW